MANFKIGDRVRVRDTALPEFVGVEARIVALVDHDCVLGEAAAELEIGGERNFWGRLSDLSPILPTPSAADILALESLPDFDCPLPVRA